MATKSKIFYEVWGRDTFAGEDFLCGKFASLNEANLLCQKQQNEVAQTQDKALLDTFWVSKITDEEIEVRRIRNEQIEREKYNECSYDSGRLRECTRELLKQFGEKLKGVDVNERLKLRTNEILYLIAKKELNCFNKGGCYNKLNMELSYCDSGLPYRINFTISFNSGYRYSGGDCSQAIRSFDSMDEVVHWLNVDKTIENVCQHLHKLIGSFYS